ncbi:hypothetical protein GCM10009837_23320 [Streptomyces durmitorensis]|uniref:Uncharacterized protein n=1 Tax=Streptomyces durmitorensis TaxID=319947 RepID=A0ABY4PQ80_9ACTN|nr:hypothetical protein [Streptomyces durmitorensis]UQT55044.1 hypothetical protein M4V62_08015 [Streptomyces durmitorensis]
MEGFFDGLDQAVRERNWHAALVLALTLPDICVKASDPDRKTSRSRYAAWFEEYVAPAYTLYVGTPSDGEEVKFLSGKDCYALRCALLHEGSDNTTAHEVREALDGFHFCTPGERGISVHMNKSDRALNLMVDTFAQDVLAGARTWWETLPFEEQNAARTRQIALHSTDGDIQFS